MFGRRFLCSLPDGAGDGGSLHVPAFTRINLVERFQKRQVGECSGLGSAAIFTTVRKGTQDRLDPEMTAVSVAPSGKRQDSHIVSARAHLDLADLGGVGND